MVTQSRSLADVNMRISLYTRWFANLTITAYRFLYKVQLYAQMKRGAASGAKSMPR